jgi:hypothetical protein
MPFAVRREMGEATANVLAQDGHEGKTYHPSATRPYGFTTSRTRSLGAHRHAFHLPERRASELHRPDGPGRDRTCPGLSAFITDMRDGRNDIVTDDLTTCSAASRPASVTGSLRSSRAAGTATSPPPALHASNRAGPDTAPRRTANERAAPLAAYARKHPAAARLYAPRFRPEGDPDTTTFADYPDKVTLVEFRPAGH